MDYESDPDQKGIKFPVILPRKESRCNYIGGVKKKKGGDCFEILARHRKRHRDFFRVIIVEERNKEIVTSRIELLKQITRPIRRLFWKFMKLVKRTDEIHEGGVYTVALLTPRR